MGVACATLVHEAGGAIRDVGAVTTDTDENSHAPRWLRRGPRSLLLAKLFSEDFKPKFVSRTLHMWDMLRFKGNYRVDVEGIKTPHQAVVGKLVKAGEQTTINFSKSKIGCSNWVDTKKVKYFQVNGDPVYEQKCTQRRVVDNEYEDVPTATAFTNGLTPGAQIIVQYDFPIVATKGNKYVAALGIKL